jgi:hypothetical protein
MNNKQQAPIGVVLECKVQSGHVEMPDGSYEWKEVRNWRVEVVSEIYLEPGTGVYTTPPAQPAHLAQVVRAHIQDLRACLPTLREHKLSDTAAEVEKAANELEAAAAQPAQAEVTVPDDMSHAGEIKIKIAPDGDIHITASGKDTWTGNDATVVIELTASGGREGAKWHSIFRAAMLTATTQPAAQPAPADTDLMACWVEKPDGTIDGIASMRLALSKYGAAAQPAQPAVPDLTHDQWDEWQNKHGLILEREALDELRSMLYTTPPTEPAPVWRYWKVKDRCVVTGPFTTTSKEEAYGPDCIDATPLTVPAAQPAAPLTAWQPIETAPRDGRWVITFDGETVSPNYYLGSEIEHWAKTPLLVNPTHWMPIPTAPDKGGAVCRL